MRWVCGVLAVVVASGCKHHFECVAHGGSVVRQVETEHFVVTADLDEDLLTRQAAQLEQLWGAWAIFFHHVPQTPTKLQVLLSRSGATSEFSEGNMGFVRFKIR